MPDGITWLLMCNNPALSFGRAAADYDRLRPPYPVDAVRWAVGRTPPATVVDVGAGTGILSRALAAAGYAVRPVEPDAGMRAQLGTATPGTTPLAGCAEEIPLADDTADAAVAGQAYHWFDPDRAHAEIARVLRPGGTFAALWNVRDEAEPWVAELSRVAAAAGDAPHAEPATYGERFGPVEHRVFRHEVAMTPDDLVAMMTTRSYYLVAGPAERGAFEAALRELVATHPDLRGRERFALPYRTDVYRASTLRS
jgi:SAM-dependent methyltransferase